MRISPAESRSELGLGIADTLRLTYKLGRYLAARGLVSSFNKAASKVLLLTSIPKNMMTPFSSNRLV